MCTQASTLYAPGSVVGPRCGGIARGYTLAGAWLAPCTTSFFCEHSKPVFPANHHRTRVLRVHVHIAPLKLQKSRKACHRAQAAVESFTATRPRVGFHPHRRVSLQSSVGLTNKSLTRIHAFASAACRSRPAADPAAYLRLQTRARRTYSRGSPKPLGQCQGQLSAPEPQQFYSRRKTKPARAWPQVRSNFETSVPRLSVHSSFDVRRLPKAHKSVNRGTHPT